MNKFDIAIHVCRMNKVDKASVSRWKTRKFIPRDQHHAIVKTMIKHGFETDPIEMWDYLESLIGK